MGLINSKDQTIDNLKQLERLLNSFCLTSMTKEEFEKKYRPLVLAEAIDYVQETEEA